MKTAIITGASRGIGKAVALDLAEQDYTVILLARSAEKLKEVVAAIEKKGGACDTYAVDVTDYEKINQVVTEISNKYENIDVLFNNAGILHLGSIELEPQQIDALIDINLKGTIYLTGKIAPIMKQQQSGYIINLSSRAGTEAFAEWGLYCASKFGMCGYNESLFDELLPEGIKVTAICPSFVDTEMQLRFSPEQRAQMIPQNEIVRAVNYLLQTDERAAIKELVIYCTDSVCGKL